MALNRRRLQQEQAPPDKGERIPATLQTVFLASNRGKEVHKPPPGRVAQKTYFKKFVFWQASGNKKKKKKASGDISEKQRRRANEQFLSPLPQVQEDGNGTTDKEELIPKLLRLSAVDSAVAVTPNPEFLQDYLTSGGATKPVPALGKWRRYSQRQLELQQETMLPSSPIRTSPTKSAFSSPARKSALMLRSSSSRGVASPRRDLRNKSTSSLMNLTTAQGLANPNSRSESTRNLGNSNPLLQDTKAATTTSRSNLNPEQYLEAMIRCRGYSVQRFNTIKTAYRNKPTPLQLASYHCHLVNLARREDIVPFTAIMRSGISKNPTNEYGESLLHTVCRLGNAKLLKVLVDVGCSLQVCDDYGRTPLHDACWAVEPNFDMVELILTQDRRLLHMMDHHGAVPLSYVPRENWSKWLRFLERHKQVFWPPRNVIKDGEEEPPLLTRMTPNSNPIQDPYNALTTEIAKMVVSGMLSPAQSEYVHRQQQRLMAVHRGRGDDRQKAAAPDSNKPLAPDELFETWDDDESEYLIQDFVEDESDVFGISEHVHDDDDSSFAKVFAVGADDDYLSDTTSSFDDEELGEILHHIASTPVKKQPIKQSSSTSRSTALSRKDGSSTTNSGDGPVNAAAYLSKQRERFANAAPKSSRDGDKPFVLSELCAI